MERLNSSAGLDPRKYFMRHETTSFSLAAGASELTYPMSATSDIPASVEDIAAIVSALDYEVNIGGRRICCFNDHRADFTVEKIRNLGLFGRRRGCVSGPFSVVYETGKLSFRYEEQIAVQGSEIMITVDERTLIPCGDYEWFLAMLEATRGLTVRFSAPEGTKIIECGASPNCYYRTAGQTAKVEITDRSARITTDSWVLPGIAAVVSWR
jgi:hypothetical protein